MFSRKPKFSFATGTPVRVVWVDSCTGTHKWKRIDKLDDSNEPLHIESVGFIVRDERGIIELTGNRSMNEEENPQTVMNIIIPKMAIVSIHDLVLGALRH